MSAFSQKINKKGLQMAFVLSVTIEQNFVKLTRYMNLVKDGAYFFAKMECVRAGAWCVCVCPQTTVGKNGNCHVLCEYSRLLFKRQVGHFVL